MDASDATSPGAMRARTEWLEHSLKVLISTDPASREWSAVFTQAVRIFQHEMRPAATLQEEDRRQLAFDMPAVLQRFPPVDIDFASDVFDQVLAALGPPPVRADPQVVAHSTFLQEGNNDQISS